MSKAEIGTFIRQKRENLRISQEAVAFILDMSQAAYSKIERNETKVKVDQVYKIANYFGISIYELLPPSLASDIAGENIFGVIAHYIKIGFQRTRVLFK
ncbi:helix-turn-helix transcriptional regulator [Sphingobacterium sp. SRCM116780]|uniref:helix-turn-helix domain-containing protein n=1 Tax=Sphingobacterium sp. SRCM116780 TaxID=2907623 RepID=UPI001F26E7F2|nr:helix-turn-helix transcriptional regulator [Sphingobacterium sp. SRCM116780]UIR54797.1 helix-turn-helix transcriptional regulator [Sphingobacterium sp. SRCM116780]